MKPSAYLSLTASLLLASTAIADHRDRSPSSAQAISNFVSGGVGTSLMPAMPQNARDVTLPAAILSSSPFNFDPQTHQDNLQWSSSDFSSVFAALSAGLSEHSCDSQSLNDLQTFINNLHLDPALLSKLQMFVQNLENAHSQQDGDMNSNEDDHDGDMNSGDQDEHDGDIAGNDNDNDQGHDMDNDNDDEHGDIDDDDIPIAVPEPSTFAMMLAGATLLGGTLLRRRAK